MNKETFCSLPFTEIFLGPDGNIKTCCSAASSIGSLHTDSIDEIINSPKAKDIRQHILDGKWHPNCRQCKQQEDQGVRSERISDSETLIQDYNTLDKHFFKLQRLDLRWSNTCNLSCVYCYEFFSSKWSDIKGIKVNTIKDENEQSLFNFIKQNIENGYQSKGTIMLGGEPLLQKQNSKLIEMLSGTGFYIITNLAVPLKTNKIAQQLLQEKECNWGVSFENVGDRYEYVRRGASWNTFVENVDYYHSISDQQNRLEAHSLYSVYSAFNLVEFYDFITSKNFKNVFWNLLESSGNNVDVNVLNMSTSLKEKAICEIELCEKLYATAPGIESLSNIKNLLIKNNNIKFNNKKILTDITTIESQIKNNHTLFKDLWPDVHTELGQ